MMQNSPTPEQLRTLLRYEPETGRLFWRERSPDMFDATPDRTPERLCCWWNGRFAGQQAFTTQHPKGWLQGTLAGKTYMAHRVIWAMQTGAWPVSLIDHEDRDNSNNKWGNLREANHGQNCCNRSSSKSGTSQYLGVSFKKSHQRWVAQLKSNGSVKHLGLFDVEVDAARAYDAAAIAHHGEFASTNFGTSS